MNSPYSAIVHQDAHVSDTAHLGDLVAVYPGAYLDDESHVVGFTQIWGGVRLERGAILGSGVALDKPINSNLSEIVFGVNCRVGAGSTICQGVKIGEGAVVEPGSVVTQNVPPYAIVTGIPARITGYIETYTSNNLVKKTISPSTFSSDNKPVHLGVGDVTLHQLKIVTDMRGDLSVGEFSRDIPFEPKRYFLVFNVPNEKNRGEHAHHKCHQFLICVKGSCAFVVDDGKNRIEILLDSPDKGIYVPPLIWGVQYKYSNDAVLLVFTSDYYDANDYIRNYSEFINIVTD